MIKIAILSRYQNTNSRGVESFVFELSQRLKQYFEVNILEGRDSDDLGKILQGNYDIVMPMNGRMQSLKASLGRIFGKYKLVIGGHSGIGRDDLWNIIVVRPDVFITLTQRQLHWAKSFGWGINIKKIPNGIDTDKFNPKGKKFEFDLPAPIILSVGELVWYKYHDRLIEAVSLLEKGSLVLVGSGEDKENLEKLGIKKLTGRFKIIKANYEQMPEIYRGADVFSLSSWDREAFGLVYLEALSSGLPVVAPDDDSRREIVGNAGVLVDTSHIVSYAKGLEKALGQNFLDKSTHQAEKFSWDKVFLMYKELFEKLNA